MVKKIRLVEDEITDDELDTQEFQTKMLEYQHAMDWKLWEIYGIILKWAAREGFIEPDPEPKKEAPKRRKKKAKIKGGIKSIIVDDNNA